MNIKLQKKKPYSCRTLENKILSNWEKTIGLYNKGEYSTVVIRAATTVELSANLLIKFEFQINNGLPESFIKNLMLWANGLNGKIKNLLLPFFKGTETERDLKEIKNKIKHINKERNNIVHKGQFKEKETAKNIIFEAQFIINKFSLLASSKLKVSAEIK